MSNFPLPIGRWINAQDFPSEAPFGCASLRTGQWACLPPVCVRAKPPSPPVGLSVRPSALQGPALDSDGAKAAPGGAWRGRGAAGGSGRGSTQEGGGARGASPPRRRATGCAPLRFAQTAPKCPRPGGARPSPGGGAGTGHPGCGRGGWALSGGRRLPHTRSSRGGGREGGRQSCSLTAGSLPRPLPPPPAPVRGGHARCSRAWLCSPSQNPGRTPLAPSQSLPETGSGGVSGLEVPSTCLRRTGPSQSVRLKASAAAHR